MIDPTLPMELDDGTPVKLHSHRPGSLSVKLPKGPYRKAHLNQAGHVGLTWYYDPITGVFGGGTPERFFTVRNVAGSIEPEEYEGWFV